MKMINMWVKSFYPLSSNKCSATALHFAAERRKQTLHQAPNGILKIKTYQSEI